MSDENQKLYKVNINFDYIIEENILYLKAENEAEAIKTAKWYLISPTGKEEIKHFKTYSSDCAKMNENNMEVKVIESVAELQAMIEAIDNGTLLRVK